MMRCLTFLVLLTRAVPIAVGEKTASISDPSPKHRDPTFHPIGDPRSCSTENNKLVQFEVLPGIGWDNLRNEDASNIFVYNYSLCKTTLDGRFLIPDHVESVPRKSSKVNTFAEMISHFTEYTSATSHSINIHAGVSSATRSIAGSFSASFQNMKSKQIGDKSVTTRVQLRYVRYTASLKSNAKLNSDFKARLIDIAKYLGQNKSDEARFKSQMLVRDFGTHFLRSVDAGALLVQEDQISSNYVNTKDTTTTQIKIGASASFFQKFNFGLSYSYTSSKSEIDKYEQQRSSSETLTYGGPKFKANNFTASDWADGVDENLVPVDRQGDPLQYLITTSNIPELSAVQVRWLYNAVKEAVDMYYQFNTYRGCTKLDSPNFSPAANVDDGHCSDTVSSTMFGGVYQTCSLDERSSNGDICSGYTMNRKNPITGHYSCPPGYQAVKIHTATLSTGKPNPNCYICDDPILLCCYDEQYSKYRYSSAEYSLYWCAETESVPPNSGYLFGGVFTSHIPNPLTQGNSCPPNFNPQQLGTDLKVCISDDYELGSKYAVPFGGFISCESGNPLAVKTFNNTKRASVRIFDNWPKRCPAGFSQHLAYVDKGCEISYCIKSGSLSSKGLPLVRRPPFMDPPDVDSAVKCMTLDPVSHEWKKVEDAVDRKEIPNDAASTSVRNSLSTGGVVGIAIGTMILGCVATVVITAWFRRRGSSPPTGERARLITTTTEPTAVVTVS